MQLGDGRVLRFVRSYKHLGTMFSPTGALGVEVGARVSSAMEAYRPLARRVFRSALLSQKAKKLVMHACFDSRLLLNAQVWEPLAQGHVARLVSARQTVLRAVAGVVPGQPPHRSCLQVRQALQEPPVPLLIRIKRLGYFARLAASAPPALRALLQSNAGSRWHLALTDDLSHFRSVMRSKLASLPDPRAGTARWEQLAASFPSQWRALVRAYGAKVLEDDLQLVDGTPTLPLELREAQFGCPTCGTFWPDAKSLASHRFGAHGERRWIR